LTTPSGLEFQKAYDGRIIVDAGGIAVPVIDLTHLRRNKRAAGRLKDLADLDNLPETETE
jgi:hypothetical protein